RPERRRGLSRGGRRSQRVRTRLEHGPAERDQGARRRRHPDGLARARRGGEVTMKVLAIAGSLRADSHNRRLTEAAAALIAARGVEVEILDPEALRSLPHFDQALEAASPEPVIELRKKIADADGLLLATPEY